MNSKTLFYIVKRLILAIVTILVVVTITFWAIRAIPGDPFSAIDKMPSEVKEQLRKSFGLDKPVFIQYLKYLAMAFTWNFGLSMKTRGIPVIEMIGSSLPASLITGLSAAAIAIVLGIILGSIAAYKHNKIVDRIIMVGSTASVAMPSFVIASLFIFIFYQTLMWETPGGLVYLLPILTISLSPACYITRLTRSSTLDVLGSDYIRTANAKGVSKSKILFKHSLKNSLTPVITYAGPMIAYIITGSIVVEKLFSIDGLGRMFVESITQRDYSVVMGTTIFLTYLMVIMVLISDILYKIVNPRVELE